MGQQCQHSGEVVEFRWWWVETIHPLHFRLEASLSDARGLCECPFIECLIALHFHKNRAQGGHQASSVCGLGAAVQEVGALNRSKGSRGVVTENKTVIPFTCVFKH